VACHRSGDMIGTVGFYQKVLQRFPDQPDALHFLGVITGEMGELEKVVKLIDRSQQLDPGNAVYFNNYGNVLRQAGAPMDAIAASWSLPLLLRTGQNTPRSASTGSTRRQFDGLPPRLSPSGSSTAGSGSRLPPAAGRAPRPRPVAASLI